MVAEGITTAPYAYRAVVLVEAAPEDVARLVDPYVGVVAGEGDHTKLELGFEAHLPRGPSNVPGTYPLRCREGEQREDRRGCQADCHHAYYGHESRAWHRHERGAEGNACNCTPKDAA
jgi:hypothetical protein